MNTRVTTVTVNGEPRHFPPGTALDVVVRSLTAAPRGWPRPSTKPSSRAPSGPPPP